MDPPPAADPVQVHDTGEWSPICRPPRSLVEPVPVGGAGGPTKAAAAGSKWRRSSRGLYVPARVSDDVVEQRILEQARRLPPQGAVTGWAALRLAGGAYFDGLSDRATTRRPVPLVVEPTSALRSGRGASVTTEPLAEHEVWTIAGIRCTTPTRALFDEVRQLGSLRERVVAIDMSAAARLVAPWQLSDYVEAHSRWRRSTVLPPALALADEWSRSPAESRMRLIWVLDAGLPPPLCNRPVFDLNGRHLGTPDLLDVDAGVAGEYDGAAHMRIGRRGRDVAREGRLRGAGLEYFSVVGSDVHDTALVVERMVATRQRALSRPLQRSWTIVAPDEWEPRLSYGDELRLRQWHVEAEG